MIRIIRNSVVDYSDKVITDAKRGRAHMDKFYLRFVGKKAKETKYEDRVEAWRKAMAERATLYLPVARYCALIDVHQATYSYWEPVVKWHDEQKDKANTKESLKIPRDIPEVLEPPMPANNAIYIEIGSAKIKIERGQDIDLLVRVLAILNDATIKKTWQAF